MAITKNKPTLDQHKLEFGNMIAHELRTPLIPILGHCEMLQDPKLLGTLNKDQLESVEEIKNNAVHLERLIEKILDFQRLEFGLIAPRIEEITIDGIFNLILDNFSDNTSRIILKKPIGLIMNTDKVILQKILESVIDNALRFSSGVINIQVIDNSSHIMFSIIDDGCGISNENLNYIFEPYRQFDSTKTRLHEGIGISLAISKKFVDLLHGKIWIESSLKHGTTVTFTLPKN